MKEYIILLKNGKRISMFVDDIEPILQRLECIRSDISHFDFLVGGGAVVRIDEICAITEKVKQQ